jgi:hypothetical protein
MDWAFIRHSQSKSVLDAALTSTFPIPQRTRTWIAIHRQRSGALVDTVQLNLSTEH